MAGIVHVGHTTTHTSGEVAPRLTQYYHATACHILTAMVTSTFNHSDGTRVAHAKTFAHLTIDVEFATSSTIQARVSCDDIVFGLKVVATASRR